MAEPAEEMLDLSLRLPQSQVSELMHKNLKRVQQEREDLSREQETYAKMRRSVAEVHFKDPVVLDVGGMRFKTSLTTLRRDKDSMLAAMFSGSGFEMTPGEDGSFFIDRDGTHFRHILNYLRGCFRKEGLSNASLHELAAEADFYQLRSLYSILRPPSITLPPTTLGKGLLCHLGTSSGTCEWTNPALSGKVNVTGTFDSLPAMIARSADEDTGSCHDARGKYIIVDLRNARLRPTHYSLAYNGSCDSGGTWELSGRASEDGQDQWRVLSTVPSCASPSTTSPLLFPITTHSETLFQQFKLTCTGPDRSGPSSCCFHMGQLEFYGHFVSALD
mmetsp:Transcript_1218/g.3431  ORF Transcript_1218/g.3431 Transcript_1218/m.3431 type:complete len:332 (-) Transcript_1218:148-1143(-)